MQFPGGWGWVMLLTGKGQLGSIKRGMLSEDEWQMKGQGVWFLLFDGLHRWKTQGAMNQKIRKSRCTYLFVGPHAEHFHFTSASRKLYPTTFYWKLQRSVGEPAETLISKCDCVQNNCLTRLNITSISLKRDKKGTLEVANWLCWCLLWFLFLCG